MLLISEILLDGGDGLLLKIKLKVCSEILYDASSLSIPYEERTIMKI